MNTCPFCGSRVALQERNCPGCGATLDSAISPPPPASTVTDEEQEILHLAKASKIMAIKRYRELHRVGLKEAKDAVESLMARHGIVPEPVKGYAPALFLAMVIPILIYWLFFS